MAGLIKNSEPKTAGQQPMKKPDAAMGAKAGMDMTKSDAASKPMNGMAMKQSGGMTSGMQNGTAVKGEAKLGMSGMTGMGGMSG